MSPLSVKQQPIMERWFDSSTAHDFNQEGTTTMAKIFIREDKSQCNAGDYYRDPYKCYFKYTGLSQWSAWRYEKEFQRVPDPTENLVRKDGYGAFQREKLVLCKVADMRPGCARTGSGDRSAVAAWESGSPSLDRCPGYAGGPSDRYASIYAYCRPGDVMAFDADTTVTTLSAKNRDKLTKDVKHGQTFVLDDGTTVYAVTKKGFKLPAGYGWVMLGTNSAPASKAEMWPVQTGWFGYQATHGVSSSEGALATLVTGKVEPDTAGEIEGIARLAVAEAATKAAQIAAEEAADKGRFIVWSPGSTLPVTTEYTSGKQATAVAVSMASKHKGQTFITARLVEEFTEEKPVETKLKRVKL